MAEQFDVDQAREVIEGGLGQAQEILSDPAKVEELFNQLQEKIKDLPAGAGEALSNIPLMAQMVKGYITREYTEVSPKVVATLVSAFLYLVATKDVIRDDIPLLGIVDDIAVIALAMKVNEAELAAFKQWQEQRAAEGDAAIEDVIIIDEADGATQA